MLDGQEIGKEWKERERERERESGMTGKARSSNFPFFLLPKQEFSFLPSLFFFLARRKPSLPIIRTSDKGAMQ